MNFDVNYVDGTMDLYVKTNSLFSLSPSETLHLTPNHISKKMTIDFTFKGKVLRILYVKAAFNVVLFYDNPPVFNEITFLLKENPKEFFKMWEEYCKSSEELMKIITSLYVNTGFSHNMYMYLDAYYNDKFNVECESAWNPIYVDSLDDTAKLFEDFCNKDYMASKKAQEIDQEYQLRNDSRSQLAEDAYKILPDIVRMEPFTSHNSLIAFRRVTVGKNFTSIGKNFSYIELYSSYNPKEAIYVHNIAGLEDWINYCEIVEPADKKFETCVYIPDDISLYSRALACILPELRPYIVKKQYDERIELQEDANESEAYPLSVDADNFSISKMDDYSFDIFLKAREEWGDAGIRQLVNIKREDYERVLQGYDKSREACEERTQRQIIEQTVQVERKTKLSGIRGEKEVEYVLNWLSGNSIFIADNTTDKFDNPCIKLKNKDFKDEAQEFDHIAIRENGVFIIETKNYGGKIVISEDGNWSHTNRKGETKGLRNPSQQVYRHEVLIKSILPKDTPVISLICLSNSKLLIEGQSNSKIPVFKSDLIADYIVGYKPKAKLSLKEMKKIKDLIESYYSD